MKKELTAWIINAGNGTHHLETYPVGTYFGPVDLGWDLSEKYGGLNFGIGLLSGSIFSGSNRLIVTGQPGRGSMSRPWGARGWRWNRWGST